MAVLNVTLRIVGLYFNEPVKVNSTASSVPTVRDVIDAYIKANPNLAKRGGLEYQRFPIMGNPDDFATTFTYHYPGEYNYDGNNELLLQPDGPDGPTLGNQFRTAGIYRLSEDLEDNFPDKKVGLVWQYYVLNAAGILRSRTPDSRGFKSFGTFAVANGDTIIWRLVAVVREPNFLT